MLFILQITHEYVIRASDSILNSLRGNNLKYLAGDIPEVSPLVKPLTHIMFHIEDTTFDQVSDALDIFFL